MAAPCTVPVQTDAAHGLPQNRAPLLTRPGKPRVGRSTASQGRVQKPLSAGIESADCSDQVLELLRRGCSRDRELRVLHRRPQALLNGADGAADEILKLRVLLLQGTDLTLERRVLC